MTNLIHCVQKPTPTGIDRIDLMYACFLIRFNWIELRPVYVKGNAVHLIPLHKLKRVAKRVRRIWAGKESPEAETGIFGKSIQGFILRWLHRKLRIKFNTANKGYYINISQRNLASSGVIEWIKVRSYGAVCMIHDLLPITHRSFFDKLASVRHEEKLSTMIRLGTVMVCGSRSCQSELSNFANISGVLQINTLYAPFGCKRLACGSIDFHKESLQNPFFLMLGTFESRKNHQFVLKIWLEMIDQYGLEKTPNLVMAGRMGDVSQTIRQILADEAKLAAKVSIIDAASDTEISGLMKSAEALVIPSIAEGYGLPLYEAFAQGTPVIAAEIEVFDELSQKIATLISLERLDIWVSTIHDFNLSGERERQKQMLKHWRRPTWAAHFRQVISACENSSAFQERAKDGAKN